MFVLWQNSYMQGKKSQNTIWDSNEIFINKFVLSFVLRFIWQYCTVFNITFLLFLKQHVFFLLWLSHSPFILDHFKDSLFGLMIKICQASFLWVYMFLKCILCTFYLRTLKICSFPASEVKSREWIYTMLPLVINDYPCYI